MVQPTEEDQPNRITDLFADKTLFITGGTGFLGKVLIEKLLRCCTGIRKIYILIRNKKGKSGAERLEEIFKGPLYEMCKQQHGKSVFSKVEAVSGDVSSPGLGLSEEDRKRLIEEVEIIYHSAASVRFDEPLKSAILINVKGTKQMLALAKECRKLLVFCHLSTAYCQENQEVLEEKTYPPPADPYHLIDICEWMDEKTLDMIADRIRGTSANNYTFAKALGEALVADQMNHLPVIIQRPSAVIPIYHEPLPGWTDNINGPTGLLIGAGKGVIRTMYGQGDNFADYVPVDVVSNGLIISAFDYITYKTRRVYNITASDEHKITFQELLDMGRIVVERTPFNWGLWYPGGSMKQSKVHHYIDFFLFMLLPAIFVDTFLIMIGFKPVLLRVQKRIYRGFTVFEYYANRKWNFRKESAGIVRGLLNAKEKKMFLIETPPEVDYIDYFTQCAKGARRYILNETDDQIPMARRRFKMMWALDRICKTLIVLGFFYLIYRKFFSTYF